MRQKTMFVLMAALALLLIFSVPAFAAEKPSDEAIAIDTVWTMAAAFLVFFMQAGFAFLEGGLTRAKNVGNIMMKNALDFGIASLSLTGR